VLAFASVLEGNQADLHRDMNVNYFGTLAVTRAFIPVLLRNGSGAIASVSSIVGLASMAGIGGYSASKAALASAIQSMRAELKTTPIAVFGIFPGPIDTDMAREFDMAKTSAAETAGMIFTQMEQGQEDIFPDASSAELGALWKTNPKALEQQFASA
jgi:short-subunit dehydrogenase